MASSTDLELAQQLAERVLAPLVVGGEIRPVPFLGSRRAWNVAEIASHTGARSDRFWTEGARVRQARLLCPMDVIEPPTLSEWVLLAAFNDLLWCGNPSQQSWLAPGRILRRLSQVQATVLSVPKVRQLGEALARHATFARILSVARTDTFVSWWCGSRTYHGQRPPKRLLIWPETRRVSTSQIELVMSTMAQGYSIQEQQYLTVLGKFLQATPLTDLATCNREQPSFMWTDSTLGLVATRAGRTLALRALRQAPAEPAAKALRQGLQHGSFMIGQALRANVQAVIEELEQYQALG